MSMTMGEISTIVSTGAAIICGVWALVTRVSKEGERRRIAAEDTMWKRIDELTATTRELEKNNVALKSRINNMPSYEIITAKLEKLEKHIEKHVDGLANHVKDLVAVVTALSRCDK